MKREKDQTEKPSCAGIIGSQTCFFVGCCSLDFACRLDVHLVCGQLVVQLVGWNMSCVFGAARMGTGTGTPLQQPICPAGHQLLPTGTVTENPSDCNELIAQNNQSEKGRWLGWTGLGGTTAGNYTAGQLH